jgi:hypothetical protein
MYDCYKANKVKTNIIKFDQQLIRGLEVVTYLKNTHHDPTCQNKIAYRGNKSIITGPGQNVCYIVL